MIAKFTPQMIKCKADVSRPGTWFALPLPSGGYALGIVARQEQSRRRHKSIFCYYFGPRQNTIEKLDLSFPRSWKDNILAGRSGDTYLQRNGDWIVKGWEDREGLWPILGFDPSFDKKNWPMDWFFWKHATPDFLDGVTRNWVLYDDETFKPKKIEKSMAPPEKHAERYPEDCGYGVGAIQDRVDELLLKQEE